MPASSPRSSCVPAALLGGLRQRAFGPVHDLRKPQLQGSRVVVRFLNSQDRGEKLLCHVLPWSSPNGFVWQATLEHDCLKPLGWFSNDLMTASSTFIHDRFSGPLSLASNRQPVARRSRFFTCVRPLRSRPSSCCNPTEAEYILMNDWTIFTRYLPRRTRPYRLNVTRPEIDGRWTDPLWRRRTPVSGIRGGQPAKTHILNSW